jgi:hypothetical protein
MPELVKAAFDDPSWRSNPRMPLLAELEELFWSAWRGRGDLARADGVPHEASAQAHKEGS